MSKKHDRPPPTNPAPMKTFLEHDYSPDLKAQLENCWCRPEAALPCPQCNTRGVVLALLHVDEDERRIVPVLCGKCGGSGYIPTQNLDAAGLVVIHR